MHVHTNPVRNLPPITTPFIGRQEDLRELIETLSNPECRLLTLVGPGGIGKTRLALQAAAKIPAEFKHGITFISLQPLLMPEQLVHAIADGLHFPLTEQNNPQKQLIEHLASREALLILDNFEHLIGDKSIDIVLKIIQNAPGVQLLITTHEVLNLQEEWLFYVKGLSIPSGEKTGDLESSSAAQLFTERALQVRRGFSQIEEAAGLVRICQLTGGMPLGLELAASWAKTLDCETIANEIEQNIDFLASRTRNIPDRHRDILAVFRYAWERLSIQEQDTFKKLSIFQNGFQRDAAEQVVGASLIVLTDLIDKSLIRREPSGRYQIHELLRQCGQEKLHEDRTATTAMQETYSRYYLEYVVQRTKNLMGGRQRETTLEIETELENIRAAWKWIAENETTESVGQFAMSMSLFYQYQSRYLESLAILEKATERILLDPPSRQRDLSLASVQCDISWMYIRLGQLEKAENSARASLAFVQEHHAFPSLAQGFHPLLPLGIIASIRGDYAESSRLAQTVRQESEATQHPWNRQLAYYLLTRTSLLEGDIQSAQWYAQQTYTITQENEDHWFMAYCLNELGKIASELGDNACARDHYQKSYDLRKGFEDPEGMATALINLGTIDLQVAYYQQASDHFRIAEKIYTDINDKGGIATSIFGLARVAAAQHDFQTAQRAFKQALQIAEGIQYFSLCTTILLDIGLLLLETGDADLGFEILALVAKHPASERDTKEHARKHLPADQPLPQEITDDLDSLVNRLLMHFPELEIPSPAHQTASFTPDQGLIDPLTSRELEVLQLIAEGFTNKQIAKALFISPGTAKWYTSQIYSKLAVQNRTQAVARARELGLIRQ